MPGMAIYTVGITVLDWPGTQDSTVVESPLPGGPAAVVRFLFQTVPQWLQITGAVLAVIAAGVAFYLLFRYRRTMAAGIRRKPRVVRTSLVLGVLTVVIAAAGAGITSWDYMQHDNGFCTGCHVMKPAFERFTASEHDSLSCHDCHRQSIFASLHQLYMWVAERPKEIHKHAAVPDTVCQKCHVTGKEKVWQRIASTAGHRTHLESDSSTLAALECVTCHGVEVHKFVPSDSTCGQSDCHTGQDIVLGRMAGQSNMHCVTCHEFTEEVPALATRDSAAGTLVPKFEQCASCHAMDDLLAEFEPGKDPHNASCGSCHNPHEQKDVKEASESCTTSGCHTDWENEPFHVGPRHFDTRTQCTLCHEPHRARVDASDCEGCHRTVLEKPIPGRLRRKLERALPFDTTGALQSRASKGREKPRLPMGPAGVGFGTLPSVQDTFSHKKHERLTCVTCHLSNTAHGKLTFTPPRGCRVCHHRDPYRSDCVRCHEQDLRHDIQLELTVTVQDTIRREHRVVFSHDSHASRDCSFCHEGKVALEAAPGISQCVTCHDEHHEKETTCGSCHEVAFRDTVHTPDRGAHTDCGRCHQQNTIDLLLPGRPLCLTCHPEQSHGHYEKQECTSCHMQMTPAQLRSLFGKPRKGDP